MRLSKAEQTRIRKIIQSADNKAEIYLFGSRKDDSLKGGDLDLLVVSETIEGIQKIDILVDLKEALGDQKIDLILHNPTKEPTAFVAKILDSAIRLE